EAGDDGVVRPAGGGERPALVAGGAGAGGGEVVDGGVGGAGVEGEDGAGGLRRGAGVEPGEVADAAEVEDRDGAFEAGPAGSGVVEERREGGALAPRGDVGGAEVPGDGDAYRAG